MRRMTQVYDLSDPLKWCRAVRFERTKPIFNGSVYLMMRDDLDQVRRSARSLPRSRGASPLRSRLLAIVPVNKRFGFSVATGYSTQFSHQVGHTNTWRGVSTATNGTAFPHTTPGRPCTSRPTNTPTPRRAPPATRWASRSISGYHLRPHLGVVSVLRRSTGGRQPATCSLTRSRSCPGLHADVGQGVVGAGNIQITSGNGRVRENRTYMPTFNWRHDGPVWKFDGGVGRAYGTDNIRSSDQGFWQVVAARRTGVTVGFDQIIDTRPASSP